MANGPELWDAVLFDVNVYAHKGVMIAGGAVRDYVCRAGAPKDIDVFYVVDPDAGFINDAPWWQENQVVQLGEDEYQEQNLLRVTTHEWYDPETDDEYSVQLMACRDLQAHLRTFDWSLCRMWYNQNGIHLSKQAGIDLGLKRFTLMNASNLNKSEDRVRRWFQRAGYEGYEAHIPDNLRNPVRPVMPRIDVEAFDAAPPEVRNQIINMVVNPALQPMQFRWANNEVLN